MCLWKVGLMALCFLFSRVEGEVIEAVMDGVKFELRDGEDVLRDDCEERLVVGFNNVGQVLFYEDEELVLWDSHQETCMNVSKLLGPDLFMYCPWESQCLNDEGEVIGFVDFSVAKWSVKGGLVEYPLPDELRNQDWHHFYVHRMEFLADGRILLVFGDSYFPSDYYVLDNGVYTNVGAYLRTYTMEDFPSHYISQLHINKRGDIAGVLSPDYFSHFEDELVFKWDGSTFFSLNMHDVMKRKDHDPEALEVLALLDNGDVMIYFDDYKSIHMHHYTYRAVIWHTKTGEIEPLLSGSDFFPGSFNSKGNGVFLKNFAYHVLYNGVFYNLTEIFHQLELDEEDFCWDYCSFYGEEFYFDQFVKINENDEVLIDATNAWGSDPVVISLSAG